MSRVRGLRLAAVLACVGTPAFAEVSAAGSPGTAAAPADKLSFQAIARREAERAGLPYSLVDAVMKIESDYRPDRIGGVGEIGLMQVRPTTAAVLGFRGTPAELADPATNIHFGAAYLGAAWRLAKGNVCRTLMKYRAGHGAETMSSLSVTYCQRARVHLASIGSPLAATITPLDLVAVAEASIPSETLRVAGRPKTGQAFWTAFQARIKRINASIESKWRRQVAAR